MNSAHQTTAAARDGVKTLVVHIGDHKTGSTSIQNAFAAGRVRTGAVRLAYPGVLNHNYLPASIAQAYGAGRPRQAETARQRLQALAQAAAERDCAFCLLSGEMFEGTDPQLLKQAYEEYFAPHFGRIRVIAYVRPHAERILSGFAESTKIGGFRGSLEAFAAKMQTGSKLRYHRKFSAWAETFGDGFVLRPMMRQHLENGDLMADFMLHAFGLRDFTLAEQGADNESLGLQELMIIKAVQNRLADQPKLVRHTIGRELARALGAHPLPEAGLKLKLHRSLAEDIAAAFREDAQAADAAFFGGADVLEGALMAAPEKAAAAPMPVNPGAYFPPQQIRMMRALGDVINLMLQNETGNWADFFQSVRINQLHGTSILEPRHHHQTDIA